MKNTCKNCKHWKVSYDGNPFEVCDMLTQENHALNPKTIMILLEGGVVNLEDKFYDAEVNTHRDFGCNHFKKLPK